MAQVARDLDLHVSVVRSWVHAQVADPTGRIGPEVAARPFERASDVPEIDLPGAGAEPGEKEPVLHPPEQCVSGAGGARTIAGPVPRLGLRGFRFRVRESGGCNPPGETMEQRRPDVFVHRDDPRAPRRVPLATADGLHHRHVLQGEAAAEGDLHDARGSVLDMD
ncbi:MAG: hypothetical protein EXR92_01770 [Gemmatimonadetes bacterium]|nr:hypothetical protein [Gemmatimonadota bacterium]